MKKISLACKIVGIVILAASLCAGCEEAIPPMPTALPTQTPVPTFTTVPTVTPTEKAPPSTEWQLSPDGHIYYKESELYDGMFTINKEHPEWVEKYWEDTIRGLWNLNYVSENTAFLSKFPTDDSLIDYLKNGGGPINNLAIPIIYPGAERRYQGWATMEKVEDYVDLSKIGVAIYNPTEEEIYKYSPNPTTGTRYIHYELAKGSVLVEKAEIGDGIFLKFTFRQDLLMDSQMETFSVSKEDYITFTVPALAKTKTEEDNLIAATRLVCSFPLRMQNMRNPDPYFHTNSYFSGEKPPGMDMAYTGEYAEAYSELVSQKETPLSVR